MAFINFGKETELGIKIFDTQHKEIVKTINHLYDIKESNKNEILSSFNLLLAQLNDHFISEESFMKEHKDIHLFSHKLEHERALAKYTDFYENYKASNGEFDNEILFSLKVWIKNHFEFKDSKLKLVNATN